MAFLPIAAAAVAAVSTIAGGIAQSNNANYQAQVAKNNAAIAEQNAAQATAAGQQQAQTESLKGAATAGQIKAGQAASGIDTHTGSAVDVQTSQREQSELDSETTLHNAQLKAYGYRVQATSDTAQAQLDQTEGTQALVGAGLNATSGLLGSASSISTKWGGGAPPSGQNFFGSGGGMSGYP